jgi:hypothetical protein
MSSVLDRPVRSRPDAGQFANLSVSRLGGVTNINIGNPSDTFVQVVCEGGVTLKIFDLRTTPLYTIIPSVMNLNNDYIFKVLNGIAKKVHEVPGKNPKAVELHSLLNGVRRMIDTSKMSMQELTQFSESAENTDFSYYTIKENRFAIDKFVKKQIYFFPDILHSMQISDDEPVFELCKVEGSTFTELTNEMFSFFKMSMKDDISAVLPLLAQFLKVRKGFTGDTRETPIPSSSKGENGGVDMRTLYMSQLFVPENIVDLLGATMFRHIGLRLSRNEIIMLFTELLYSKIPLNEGVKEVLEELLSRDFVALEQMNLYSEPKNLSMWQTSKLVPNIPVITRTKSEIAAFIFLFQTWCLDSNEVKMSFQKIAELFGFSLKFLTPKSLKILNESIKTSKTGFTFKKWWSLANSAWIKKIDHRGHHVIVKREESELHDVFDGLYNATFEPTEEKHAKKFESFFDFMQSKGIEFKECICCDKLFMMSLHKPFTLPCDVCNSSVCMSCTDKIYHPDIAEGHVLNLSSVSCINCRTIFPCMTNRFPEGTPIEDIQSHSNEFYSCCVHGCNNFARVQQEGVGCADRPDTVVDTFCAPHNYMNRVAADEMYKECPGCHATVMKSEGCNHMTCTCGAEFCMCKDCPYVKPEGGVYTHPFYCRHGISDRETRFVLGNILYFLYHAINSGDGVITQEVVERILTSMQRIVYQGIEAPIRVALFELSDYITYTTPDVALLREIHYNMHQRLDLDFPSTRRW